ncbi:MAG: hypothetical protein B6U94_07540 [Thermofilum sp. ex4484_79]|nr:MAG: hypothetical protein B6U94_07540 [Thermofilum sp. ex4484_79]
MYERRFKSGFTRRSILALIFTSFTILPVQILLRLTSGESIAAAAAYITIILFTEISVFLGNPLSKQEVFIIYSLAALAGTAAPFLDFVYYAYFKTSEIAWSLKNPYTGRPIPLEIPSFYAPPISSSAYRFRSFIHSDWILPIFAFTFQFGLLLVLMEFSLTFMGAALFIDVEELPFPIANVQAQLISTLTERDRERMKIFTIMAVVSSIYAFVLYGIPILSMGMFGTSIQIIPLPWLDMTTGLIGIEKILPGAMFGISTDPIAWGVGLLLSSDTLIYMVIGSIAVWVIGNYLALNVFNSEFPEWAAEWKPGMSLSLIWQRSYLRVWSFIHLGIFFAVSAIIVASKFKSLIKAFKILINPPRRVKEAGYIDMRILVLTYVSASLASVLFFHYLVKDYPLQYMWATVALSMGASFIFALVNTAMLGETGATVGTIGGIAPQHLLWYGTLYTTGYKGVAAFFFNPVIGGILSPSWVQAIKVAYLTETKPIDFFKAYAIAFILYHLFSFVYVSAYWAIAPIPSSVYPATMVFWPMAVLNKGMWVTRRIVAKPTLTVYSFITMLLLGAAGTILSKFGLPFSIIGLTVGITTPPPFPVAAFLGGVIGRVIIRNLYSDEWFKKYRAVIVAGIAAGEGIVIGIFSAIALMSKSAWLLPY